MAWSEKAIKRSVSKSDCEKEGKLRLVCNFMVHNHSAATGAMMSGVLMTNKLNDMGLPDCEAIFQT